MKIPLWSVWVCPPCRWWFPLGCWTVLKGRPTPRGKSRWAALSSPSASSGLSRRRCLCTVSNIFEEEVILRFSFYSRGRKGGPSGALPNFRNNKKQMCFQQTQQLRFLQTHNQQGLSQLFLTLHWDLEGCCVSKKPFEGARRRQGSFWKELKRTISWWSVIDFYLSDLSDLIACDPLILFKLMNKRQW